LPAPARLYSFPVEPGFAAGPEYLERARLTHRIRPGEDPVLPGRQAPEDAGLQRLGAAEAQIRFHRGQRVGRQARALLQRDADFVIPVELIGRCRDQAQLQRFGCGQRPPACALRLVTAAPDELDWDDEIRIVLEERASLSPDALTAMEANLRFGGAETQETRIFGRLSAWQNWIFNRPNAVGDKGALKLYGRGGKPQFDWKRV